MTDNENTHLFLDNLTDFYENCKIHDFQFTKKYILMILKVIWKVITF